MLQIALKKSKIMFGGHILLVILTEKNQWNVLRKIIAKNKSKRIWSSKSNREKGQ